MGADYKGKKIGRLSDMTTFSFHPVKHITTGEGVMIVTNDEKLYERLKLFRTHGITREEKYLSRNDGPWYYEQVDLGYNYRITDIQCALGISQMDKLDDFVEKRRMLVERYNNAFEEVSEIVVPKQVEGCNNSYHLYVIQVENRLEVFNKLRTEGIGVNVHYIPVYKHPYYQKNGYADVKCPNAEEYYEHCISLPLYPKLTVKEQDYVIEKVIESVK